MNLETLVHDSVTDHTAGHVPAPDLAAITGRELRRRVPRLALVPVVTAAAAGALVLGTVLLRPLLHDSQPPVSVQPTSGLHAHLVGSTHISILGTAHPRTHGGPRGMAVATPEGVVYLGDDRRPYLMTPDGHETPIGDPVSRDDGWFPSLAADVESSVVAWTSRAGGRTTVHVYDVAEGTEQARRVPLEKSSAEAPADDGVVHGVSRGVVVIEMKMGSGGEYRVWNTRRDDGFFEPETAGDVLVAAVAGRTILTSGDGELGRGGPGGGLEGWTVVPLKGDERDEQQYLAPDGRLRLLAGSWVQRDGRPGDPIVAEDVRTGQRTELQIDEQRLDIPQVTFDTDGSPMVLTRLEGRKGWTLYDCDVPQRGVESVECRAQSTEIRKAMFPGEDTF
ncbi:hypothetical protein [Mumia sp. Pv 4-285]|uniref:hypothetical protein n=1 Tax=Mumia qirimensis TaxID=3234852 RepID=UPI00351D8AA5